MQRFIQSGAGKPSACCAALVVISASAIAASSSIPPLSTPSTTCEGDGGTPNIPRRYLTIESLSRFKENAKQYANMSGSDGSSSKSSAAYTVNNTPTPKKITYSRFESDWDRMKVMYATEIDDDEQSSLSSSSGSGNNTTESSSFTAPRPFHEDVVGIHSHAGAIGSTRFRIDPVNHKIVTTKMREVRKTNQDRGIVAHPYGRGEALVAVFDGHGSDGELVSEFVMEDVLNKLRRHPDFEKDKETAIRETFLCVETDLEKTLQPTYSGTTACLLLLSRTNIHIANLGDSRAVLARRTITPPSKSNSSPQKSELCSVDLTHDQKPDTPSEKSRLLLAGGHVTPQLSPSHPARIWATSDCVDLGLAVSRSLGDVALKHAGVIADPIVSSYELKEEDEFLIVASDGVWELVSGGEAVRFVGEVLNGGGSVREAAQRLVRESVEAWATFDGSYRDDITVVVVRVKDFWESVGGEEKDVER